MSFYIFKKYIQHTIGASSAYKLHSPFVFDLYNEVLKDKLLPADVHEIEAWRNKLRRDKSMITVNDLGAGSKVNSGKNRTIGSIVSSAVKPKKQAAFLFRLSEFMKSRNILELGASLGITTAYLASNATARITTIEGAQQIAHGCENTLRHLNRNNVQLICSPFQQYLSSSSFKQNRFDFVYIDGNHTYNATKEYADLFLFGPHPPDVIIFDDIYWSEPMTKAWIEIKNELSSGITVDVFHFGLVFPNRNQMRQDFKLRWL